MIVIVDRKWRRRKKYMQIVYVVMKNNKERLAPPAHRLQTPSLQPRHNVVGQRWYVAARPSGNSIDGQQRHCVDVLTTI